MLGPPDPWHEVNPNSSLSASCLTNEAASESEAWLALKGSTGQMGPWCHGGLVRTEVSLLRLHGFSALLFCTEM